MIPRYQRILFLVLSVAIVLMAFFLVYERKQAHDRLAPLDDSTEIAAPSSASEESLTFYVANDFDGTITPVARTVALPQEPTVRARALLERLVADYALPASKHPLPSGPAVDDVFLVDQPSTPVRSTTVESTASGATTVVQDLPAEGGQLAIVSLRSSFVENHPSGLLVELLTLRSMVATLHSVFPQVVSVRFVVDGQPRETLAGHAGIMRPYAAVETPDQP
jgi:hypothetical protein